MAIEFFNISPTTITNYGRVFCTVQNPSKFPLSNYIRVELLIRIGRNNIRKSVTASVLNPTTFMVLIRDVGWLSTDIQPGAYTILATNGVVVAQSTEKLQIHTTSNYTGTPPVITTGGDLGQILGVSEDPTTARRPVKIISPDVNKFNFAYGVDVKLVNQAMWNAATSSNAVAGISYVPISYHYIDAATIEINIPDVGPNISHQIPPGKYYILCVVGFVWAEALIDIQDSAVFVPVNPGSMGSSFTGTSLTLPQINFRLRRTNSRTLRKIFPGAFGLSATTQAKLLKQLNQATKNTGGTVPVVPSGGSTSSGTTTTSGSTKSKYAGAVYQIDQHEGDHTYVISDIHLGVGLPVQDMHQPKSLAKFIKWAKQDALETSPTTVGRLIINGDFLDIWAVPKYHAKTKKPFTYEFRLEHILIDPNNQIVFDAIMDFLDGTSHEVVYVLGNHDDKIAHNTLGLTPGSVMEMVLKKFDNERFIIAKDVYYDKWLGIHCEHGHASDDANYIIRADGKTFGQNLVEEFVTPTAMRRPKDKFPFQVIANVSPDTDFFDFILQNDSKFEDNEIIDVMHQLLTQLTWEDWQTSHLKNTIGKSALTALLIPFTPATMVASAIFGSDRAIYGPYLFIGECFKPDMSKDLTNYAHSKLAASGVNFNIFVAGHTHEEVFDMSLMANDKYYINTNTWIDKLEFAMGKAPQSALLGPNLGWFDPRDFRWKSPSRTPYKDENQIVTGDGTFSFARITQEKEKVDPLPPQVKLLKRKGNIRLPNNGGNTKLQVIQDERVQIELCRWLDIDES